LLGNGSVNTFPRKQHTRTVFSARAVPRSYKEDSWGNQVNSVRESMTKSVSWKGAVVQRGLELGSRGVAIVRSCYQETSSEDSAGWERFSVICKAWK
jgi:hypothetical protein